MEDNPRDSIGQHDGDDQHSHAKHALRVPGNREERSGRGNAEQSHHNQDAR